MLKKSCTSNKLTVCAVLGAGNDEHGDLCSDAIQRCDLALEILTKDEHAKLILCGGFGEHFNTTKEHHYKYLKAFLTRNLNDIDTRLLGCVDSYNTIADIEGISDIIKTLETNIELIIITNDYHVMRASFLVNKTITAKNICARFLSVSSQKDIILLKARLEHEFGRVKEYLNMNS